MKLTLTKFTLLNPLCWSQEWHPLYDGIIYLNSHHKQKLKEELGESYTESLLNFCLVGVANGINCLPK